MIISTANICFAVDINDLIMPINPLDNTPQATTSFKKATLTKNDIANQYIIALNRFIQSNVRASYSDFRILIENAAPTEFMYLQMAEKMAEIGFFDLSELALTKITDDDISYMTKEDIKKFYYPSQKLSKDDELYLAEMYSNILYNEQSLEVTDELIKNVPLLEKSDYANYVVAYGYYKSNNIEEALKYINNALNKNRGNINYKKLKVQLLSLSDKPKNALKLLNEIKSQTMLTTEFTRKINSLEQYALYNTKKNEFEKKYHLAYYFYYENELNKAMRTLQTAFSTKKNYNKNVYALLSRVYFDLKEYEKAEDNATKAFKADKTNSISLLVLGDINFRKADYKNAAKYYEAAAFYDKTSYVPQVKLAQALMNTNKIKKAQDIYTKILKTHSDCYEAYYNVALTDKSREETYLKKSVAINTRFVDGWIDLARLAIEQNNNGKAEEYLTVVNALDTNNYRYYYYQGLLYKNKGLIADAKRSFKKCLSINPDYELAKKEFNI